MVQSSIATYVGRWNSSPIAAAYSSEMGRLLRRSVITRSVVYLTLQPVAWAAPSKHAHTRLMRSSTPAALCART